MLVAEINRQFPQCRPVFDKYGLAGCGGADGPPEPLFIFAAAHRVELSHLVAELNQAVRGDWKAETAGRAARSAPAEELEAENLYKRFVFAALGVALTLGFLLGAINLVIIAHGRSSDAVSGVSKQVHGHAQIFGWVGLFIMGVALHAVPRMKLQTVRPVRLAKMLPVLMLGGVILRAVGQPLAKTVTGATLLTLSGVSLLAGISAFLWILGRVVVVSEARREFHEKFLWASFLWLAVLAVWNLIIVSQMAARGWVGVPAATDWRFLHVAIFGFASNMIFGFALRVLPHFLGLRDPRVGPATIAFALWNLAIPLRYHNETLDRVATVLELVAAVLFVWALGIFAQRRVQVNIAGVDPAFGWFITLGFVWLLLATVQPFHADLGRITAAARHGMTIGFITSLMLGVGHRVLPIFNGVNLHSHRLLRGSFWCQAIGSTLVLAMAYSARQERPWQYAWAAVAGVCVLAAIVMFAWNIAHTLRVKAETFTRESAVKLTTRVAELLETYPDLRPVLIHGGLAGLAAMKHNPPRFVTLEFAARRHGIDPAPLIAALNEEIRKRKT